MEYDGGVNVVDRTTLMGDYGLDIRETEFVEEYIREVGEVEDYMMPFVIVNIRTALSVMDAAYNKTYTLEDMKSSYSYLPERTGKVLIDSMDFHGIRTL